MTSSSVDHLPLLSEAALADRRAALAFRIVTVIVIAIGLVRSLDLLTPDPTWLSMLYFTQMSNVLCLAWVALAAIRTARDLGTWGARGVSTPSARWAAAIMHAITVTMLIYIVVLVPTYDPASGNEPPFTLTDNLVHIVTPSLVILDWLLFTPKGRIRWFDPLLWVLIPYAYLAFAVIYGALGGRFESGDTFAYPFLDVATLGLSGVVTWIATLTVALLAVAYVYVVIDRILGRIAGVTGR
ncbi:Pr6Pr family membrane protein [Leucobacter luti]|uniref:Pr6Pr family membrane protein n=1 Tax=Leucobacter luti TaxID=340320 RepID=UPI003D0372C0